MPATNTIGKKVRRPNRATIKKVIDHLQEYDVSLYGQCVDLESGAMHGGNMDYDLERFLKLRDMEDKGKLWDYNEERER